MVGEPESLFSEESLQVRTERHDYDRLLMLSDGVFAIAITLLALDLRLPDRWDGSWNGLIGVTGRPLIGYLFGFGLVGVFWIAHRRLFARLQQVDHIITALNLLLLGLVGLTPFIARMIAEAGPTRALPYYFIALASVLGSVVLIRTWAAMRPGLLHPEVDRGRWKLELLLAAIGVVALAAAGAVQIVEKKPMGTSAALALVLVLAIGRGLYRRSTHQRSSTSRP
ncbi:MAG: DUF1211 domain-containing protein [Sphingomonas sp.]|nr:DUF1211 domain-containing protein [Sphingomonas sp.]